MDGEDAHDWGWRDCRLGLSANSANERLAQRTEARRRECAALAQRGPSRRLLELRVQSVHPDHESLVRRRDLER